MPRRGRASPWPSSGEVDVSDGTSGQVAALQGELAGEQRARRALVEASVRLNSLLNLPDLLKATMTAAAELLNSETSALLLLDEETNELVFEAASGGPGEGVREMRVPSGQGIAGEVLQSGKTVIVDDAANDARVYKAIDQATGFTTRSILAVPLSLRDRSIGVVEILNKKGGRFDERDQDLARALAAQAAVAIENARLYKKLADAVVESRMSYRL